jgi:hypothetical protein
MRADIQRKSSGFQELTSPVYRCVSICVTRFTRSQQTLAHSLVFETKGFLQQPSNNSSLQCDLSQPQFFPELIPSNVYAGQNLSMPDASGTIPIHPQTPTVPVKARAINARPTTIRKIRSTPPTLHFILRPLLVIYCSHFDKAHSSLLKSLGLKSNGPFTFLLFWFGVNRHFLRPCEIDKLGTFSSVARQPMDDLLRSKGIKSRHIT